MVHRYDLPTGYALADRTVNRVWWALRLSLGLAILLAGIDKFFNVLADWVYYLHPAIAEAVPPATVLSVVGVVEMIVGALILLGWTRLGGYVAGLWLLGIVVNLVAQGRYFDIAVRDTLIAMAAFSLARLTEARRTRWASGLAAADLADIPQVRRRVG